MTNQCALIRLKSLRLIFRNLHLRRSISSVLNESIGVLALPWVFRLVTQLSKS